MSFDFKGPSYRPMIQESQHMKNNGGGGNLGYFQQGKKEKDKEEQADLFEGSKDTFEPEITEEENQSGLDKLKGLLNNVVDKAKNAINNINKNENPFK